MPALTVCPECRTRLRFGADTRGQLIHCPECQASLQVTTDGRVERAPGSPRAASAADAFTSSTTLRRLAIACGLILVAFGVGWSLGTANQPEPDKDAATSKPSPVQADQPRQQKEAASQQPQPEPDRPASDVRLASATEQQPRPETKASQPNSDQTKVEPIPAVNAPAKPLQPELGQRQPQPDQEALQPQAKRPVPPPPVPREEELPAPPSAAKPVVPIEKLAQQKLQRFEVAKPTPLREVLRDLSELLAGRIELAEDIPAQELDQRVTVSLTDTTALNALEAVLKSTPLRATIRRDRIIISRE